MRDFEVREIGRYCSEALPLWGLEGARNNKDWLREEGTTARKAWPLKDPGLVIRARGCPIFTWESGATDALRRPAPENNEFLSLRCIVLRTAVQSERSPMEN